jgi:NIPSNAP
VTIAADDRSRALTSARRGEVIGATSAAEGGTMVRARFIVQVRYGHFAEYLKAAEQLNEIARKRGWAEATFWVAAAGTANELIAEVDYPDLATFDQEGQAQSSDAEWMKVIRSTVDLVVQGTGRSELLQTAPELA